MSVVISGALIDGAGIPMSGCHIILKSRVNTSEVVMRTVADVVTGNCGEYCFKAQTGKYCVYLKQDWRDEYCVGDIAVYDDSRPGTLNDFLTALDEGDLKPDVVKRFEEMVAQAQQSAEAAAESEQQAGQHVADAQQIKSDCETLADNVQQNAEAVAEDKKQVAQLASSATQDAARAEQAVKDADAIVQKAVDKLADAATLTGEAKASAEAAAKSEQNAKSHADNAAGSAQQTAQDVTATETARDDAERFAENARQDAVATAEDRKATAEDVKSTVANAAAAGQSAQDATGYAHAAEQAKNDIDVTLAGTLKTVNHLSEIAAAGTEAQQESRDNLGLKAAATMEPQSDIRDRTPGRLALSGMYGFGQTFTSADALAFNGQADFAEWLKEVMPGRYAVSIADSSTLLAGTTKFNGIIDVMWSSFDNDESDTTRKFKTLMFYNQYYEGEHSIYRLTYRWSGNDWNATVSPIIYDGDSLGFLLSRTAGSGSYFKYPAVGVPVLAVYRGTTSGDKEIKIGLGDVVPGSCLGSVNITCSISAMGVYSSTPRVGASAYSFPGRYMAISGDHGSYGEEGHICLFVRIE